MLMRMAALLLKGAAMQNLLKFFTNALVRQLAVAALELLAKRSDNTVDDQIVTIVKQGLANKADPVKRVTGA